MLENQAAAKERNIRLRCYGEFDKAEWQEQLKGYQ